MKFDLVYCLHEEWNLPHINCLLSVTRLSIRNVLTRVRCQPLSFVWMKIGEKISIPLESHSIFWWKNTRTADMQVEMLFGWNDFDNRAITGESVCDNGIFSNPILKTKWRTNVDNVSGWCKASGAYKKSHMANTMSVAGPMDRNKMTKILLENNQICTESKWVLPLNGIKFQECLAFKSDNLFITISSYIVRSILIWHLFFPSQPMTVFEFNPCIAWCKQTVRQYKTRMWFVCVEIKIPNNMLLRVLVVQISMLYIGYFPSTHRTNRPLLLFIAIYFDIIGYSVCFLCVLTFLR